MGAIGAGVIFQLVKHLTCEHENLNSSQDLEFKILRKKKPSVLEFQAREAWEAGGSLRFTDRQSSLSNEL